MFKIVYQFRFSFFMEEFCPPDPWFGHVLENFWSTPVNPLHRKILGMPMYIGIFQEELGRTIP